MLCWSILTLQSQRQESELKTILNYTVSPCKEERERQREELKIEGSESPWQRETMTEEMGLRQRVTHSRVCCSHIWDSFKDM